MNRPVVVFGMNTMFAVRQFLPEILAMVQERGMQPVVIAPGGPSDREELLRSGIELRTVPVRREIAPLSDLVALCRIWWILISVRAVVSNMSTPKLALLGGIAGWAARVPNRIYTLRGLRYEGAGGWVRRLLTACEWIACRCAHQVICTSRSLRETAVRDGIVPADKAILLGLRVSEGLSSARQRGCSAPADGSLRSSLGIPEGTPVLGFVGRLTRDKGVKELADAFARLRAQGRDLVLLIVGDFEPGDPVDPSAVQWLKSRPDVIRTGFVGNPGPYFQLMDIFALPTYREGLAMVLLEAAAASKPVVSTRTTGVVDVVVEGVTGLLVPPRDAAALARAVGSLLDAPETAVSMGQAARKLLDDHFDSSVYLKRLGDLLQSMAEPAREISPKECGQNCR